MFFLFFFVSSVWLRSGILIIFCILFMAGSGYSHSYFVYWGVIMNFVFSVYVSRVINHFCIFCMYWWWASILFPDHMSGTCHIHHLTILSQDIHFLVRG